MIKIPQIRIRIGISFIGEVCSHIGNLALVYIAVSVLKNRLLAMNKENKQWMNNLKVNTE